MLDFRADVVERQELLNGTETVTIEGASSDGGWTLVCTFSWNLGILESPAEGDLTISREDGAEVFGTLVSATVRERDGGHRFDLRFEIDGGAGAFEGATGSIEAGGSIAGDEVSGELRMGVRVRP
jgi:hypothetical protein